MSEPKFKDKVYARSPFTREEGELLLKFINHYPTKFQYARSELTRDLQPFYEYEVKCTECGKIYKHVRSEDTLTPEEQTKGGVCSNCMDDFK